MAESVTDIQGRQMRQNIVVRNIPESKQENLYKIVEHLLIEELKIPEREVGSYNNNPGFIMVDVAYRIGRYADQSIRPIVIFF